MANSVLDWVWTHSRSRHSARLVLLSLADSTGKPGGWTWPSVSSLMARTGLGERAVQTAIIELARMGELTVEYNAGPKGCNRYRIPMKTPAKSAGAQKLRGAKSAPPQELPGLPSPQVNGQNPAGSAPPAKSAPPQSSTDDPANSAPGTVKEPTEPSPTEMAGKHAVADQLTAAFWDVHRSATAQSFLAIRAIVRTAIANRMPRDHVARALNHLAHEGTAISGGAITNAIKDLKNAAAQNGGKPSTSDERVQQALDAGDRVAARLASQRGIA